MIWVAIRPTPKELFLSVERESYHGHIVLPFIDSRLTTPDVAKYSMREAQKTLSFFALCMYVPPIQIPILFGSQETAVDLINYHVERFKEDLQAAME